MPSHSWGNRNIKLWPQPMWVAEQTLDTRAVPRQSMLHTHAWEHPSCLQLSTHNPSREFCSFHKENVLPLVRSRFWWAELSRLQHAQRLLLQKALRKPICCLPDGKTDLLLNFRANLVFRCHQQLPKKQSWPPNDVSVPFSLWAEEKFKHHLQKHKRQS